MSDRAGNSSMQTNSDRQKITGSNLNILDLQWELLSSEGGYWDAERVMQTLAVANLTSLDELRSQQEIIGLWWQDRYLYPAWQFRTGGQILPGLATVLQTLTAYSDWQKLQFLLSPNSRLDREKMPLDELKAGNIDAVMLAIAE
jgi:hypothetical protein